MAARPRSCCTPPHPRPPSPPTHAAITPLPSLLHLTSPSQKWSKGKLKEKVNNLVLFDQSTYDKLIAEVPKYKMITTSILSDRLRVSLPT